MRRRFPSINDSVAVTTTSWYDDTSRCASTASQRVSAFLVEKPPVQRHHHRMSAFLVEKRPVRRHQRMAAFLLENCMSDVITEDVGIPCRKAACPTSSSESVRLPARRFRPRRWPRRGAHADAERRRMQQEPAAAARAPRAGRIAAETSTIRAVRRSNVASAVGRPGDQRRRRQRQRGGGPQVARGTAE